MNPYAISPLLCAVLALLLGGFVLSKNLKSSVNRSFALLCLETFWWQACWFAIYYAGADAQKDLIVRAGYSLILFIPFTYYHFVVQFLRLKKEMGRVRLFYFIGIFWLILLWTTNIFIAGHNEFNWGTYGKAGSVHPIYLIFVAIVAWRGLTFLKASMVDPERSALARNQSKFVFLAVCLYCFALLEYFINYGVAFYPIGVFFILGSFLVIAYAIVTLRLMDITFVIRDTTVRLASSSIPAAIFITIGIAFFSLPTMIVMIALTAVASPLLYRPLRTLFRPVILGSKYEYQQKLRRISDKWFSIFSLDRLSESLVKDVANTIGAKYCNFMIHNEDDKSYFVKAHTGFKEGQLVEEILFKEEGPLVSRLKKEKAIVVKEVLKIEPSFSGHEAVVKEMDEVKAAISVPVYVDYELKGILNLGDKVSGEIYNRQDLKILSQIARDAAVMFRYSFFNYEQSLLVYRYSHDLRTPLDPVQTYLYLMLEGKLSEEEKEKYLKIIKKNVDFVAQGLSDMYELSQMAYDHIRKKFVFKHFDIIEMVKRIVEDFTAEAKKKEIYLRFKRKVEMPLAYGHEQSIERLIRNLIQNGIKFTDKGGVEISISSERQDIKIEVSDTGQGIPGKDLPKIFNPFFKTRGRDQIVEGSGLGLTIVREIVALHSGEIKVESGVGKGTKFTVLLPVLKQKKIYSKARGR